MMEKHKRPLIDRPRYVFKHNDVINKNLKKETKGKEKVINQQLQQTISGSINKIDETVKVRPPVRPPVKPKPLQNKKPIPPRKPKITKEENKDSSMFKQMKDKFISKPKDKGGN